MKLSPAQTCRFLVLNRGNFMPRPVTAVAIFGEQIVCQVSCAIVQFMTQRS
jgi:hypothetical protein